MPRCVRQRSGWGAGGERGREGHTKTRRHEGGGEGQEEEGEGQEGRECVVGQKKVCGWS